MGTQVSGKGNPPPWGDTALGHFKHLSLREIHCSQAPPPLLAQQSLTSGKEESRAGIKAEEGVQQPSKNVILQ